MKVRLAEIDAPEKKQAFGDRSKEALSDLCFKQWAAINATAHDRFGRTVARVECQGKDASAEQVRSGMARALTRYLTGPETNARYLRNLSGGTERGTLHGRRTTSDCDRVGHGGTEPSHDISFLISEMGPEMGTDRVSAAFAAWTAAHDAWAEALFLLEANRTTPEEVTTLKAEAEALFAAATEALQR